jgi:molybdopterin/thiamine biosynthesis adenylyltransferase
LITESHHKKLYFGGEKMDGRFIRNPVTPEEQERLRASRVFVAGCGGLGGYILEYLVRMGVGHIICADDGRFEPSDMNRQLLSEPAVLGREKAACARERVLRIWSEADIQAVSIRMDRDNLPGLIHGCGLIIDALDNITTRKALFYAAGHENIPVIHAAVSGWWAQAAFIPPGGALSEKLYVDDGVRQPPGEPVKVMSFVPGMAAAVQTAYAARFLLGYPCDGGLHVWNLQSMEYRRLNL